MIVKNILRKFQVIKWFLDVRKELSQIRFELARQTRIHQNVFKILYNNTSKNPLTEYEHQTYSQNGEDGILQEIFRRINIEKGFFLEIGTGDGSENNTRLLLELGWNGTWIDGDRENIQTVKNNFKSYIEKDILSIYQQFITGENINNTLNKFNIPIEIELFSLDLDLSTHVVWEKIEVIKPKVVVIEYNGFFPQMSTWKANIKENHHWDGSINMGASLNAIVDISRKKGFTLIGCDLSGTNAFFVDNNYSKLFEDLIRQNSYESAKPFLVNSPGHRRD